MVIDAPLERSGVWWRTVFRMELVEHRDQYANTLNKKWEANRVLSSDWTGHAIACGRWVLGPGASPMTDDMHSATVRYVRPSSSGSRWAWADWPEGRRHR